MCLPTRNWKLVHMHARIRCLWIFTGFPIEHHFPTHFSVSFALYSMITTINKERAIFSFMLAMASTKSIRITQHDSTWNIFFVCKLLGICYFSFAKHFILFSAWHLTMRTNARVCSSESHFVCFSVMMASNDRIYLIVSPIRNGHVRVGTFSWGLRALQKCVDNIFIAWTK